MLNKWVENHLAKHDRIDQKTNRQIFSKEGSNLGFRPETSEFSAGPS